MGSPIHCEFEGKLRACFHWDGQPVLQLLQFIRKSDLIEYTGIKNRSALIQTKKGILCVNEGDFIVKIKEDEYRIFNPKQYEERFAVVK